jgi:dienelactone hydrolase
MRFAAVFLAVAGLAGCGGEGEAPAERLGPMSVAELRQQDFETVLTRVRDLHDGPSFSAYLVDYTHAGLTLSAMVAVPRADAPAEGFPVVIANHGYVPDPRKYGITAEGIDSRPGDYYRSVPELFASRGFLVVLPDFRGHNSSDGFDYIDPQDEYSAAYYAEDVVALMAALDGLDNADTERVFMWSHSMGGSVSMRAMLATDVVKASSFWSTMNVDEYQAKLADLDGPVMIHHSTLDESTPVTNSDALAAALATAGIDHELHRYEGGEHFFESARREHAADIDAAHFRRAGQ